MKFFSSRITNNGLHDKFLPIFTILSDKENFSIDSIPKWLNTHKLKTIFIICGGQQTLPFPDAKSNYTYGKNFTGIHLVDYRVYKINKEESLAATLFNKHKKDSLVIDILDSRYDWGKDLLSTTIPINFTFELIRSILEMVGHKPRIIVIGFSRGAMFALTLGKWLECTATSRFVISIDPVPCGWRKETFKRCTKINGRWLLDYSGFKLRRMFTDSFPVLANPGCKCWNVFQRNALLGGLDISNLPIGAAVEDAISLISGETYLSSQYDQECNKHQEMRAKYIPAVLKTIQSILAL